MMISRSLPYSRIVTGLGCDPIWFGVLLVSVVEIGLITPPIGMNLFVIVGVSKKLSLAAVSRGILPFITADLIRVILMVAIPGLVLWLPELLELG